MKRPILSFIAMISIIGSAQDYQIDFAISGDPDASPDSVVVINLDRGLQLTLEGRDVLHLVAASTAIANRESGGGMLNIYPNPFLGKAFVSFLNEAGKETILSVFDLNGKRISEERLNSFPGMTTAEVGGLPSGVYVLEIRTTTRVFSELILSCGSSGRTPEISHSGIPPSAASPSSGLKSSGNVNDLVDMAYNEGDSLSFTAYLEDRHSEVRIVPVSNTTLVFDLLQEFEDISDTAVITAEGGGLQVTDELGNIITVTFPKGAVLDTVQASLILQGTHTILPIEERQLRTFELRPLDMRLYKPAEIRVEYYTPGENLHKAALFHVETESWLVPLSDQALVEDSTSVSAKTLQPGTFAEGILSIAQINTQFDMLLMELGIEWYSTKKMAASEKVTIGDGDTHKKTWDGWKKMAGGFVSFFYLKEQNGLYDNGQNSRTEDQENLCKKVINTAVKEVLDLPIPDNLCDRDYTFTLASMVHDMEILGCQGASEYDRLNERFNQTLINCASYLEIHMNLNIESGGFTMLTSGVVPIHTTTHMSSDATVVGAGTLQVSGSASAGGGCSAVITGETAVDVNGSRDAAYTYTLTLNTYQSALMTTTCPDGSRTETPLAGEDVMEITLGLSNNFTLVKEEPVEGGGTFMMDVMLENPYTSLPDDGN